MTVVHRLAALLPAAVLAAACADAPTSTADAGAIGTGVTAERPRALLDAAPDGSEWTTRDPAAGDVGAYMAATNARLAAAGAAYSIQRAEILFTSTSSEVRSGGNVVYASDRARLQASRWVPGDARRGGRTAITYASLAPAMYAITPVGGVVSGAAAVDAAAAAWNAVPCSRVRLQKVALPAGVIPSARITLGGHRNAPGTVDVGVIGWVPASIFAAIFGPTVGPSVVGVTFIYAFSTKPGGTEYTDVDGDGKGDVAFTEVWFQNAPSRISWTTEASTAFGTTGYDAQSVALHELGHSLGLDHFGRLFENGRGEVQGAPFAVMNASAIFSQRAPAGSDVSALCESYAGWPKR
jgi:hypothetical protein